MTAHFKRDLSNEKNRQNSESIFPINNSFITILKKKDETISFEKIKNHESYNYLILLKKRCKKKKE